MSDKNKKNGADKDPWGNKSEDLWGQPPPQDSDFEKAFEFDIRDENHDSIEHIEPDTNETIGIRITPEMQELQKKIDSIPASILCPTIGVANLIQGGAVGAIFGIVNGCVEGYHHGLIRQPGFGRFIAFSSATTAFTFGGWLGCFQGSKCVFKEVRQKKDWVNTCGAGFVAGAASALRSRSPQQIMVAGLSSAVLMTIIESISGVGH